MKIKTIDVNAKEWFDKVNGNSYFAGTITVNYKMKTEKTFKMPFQYGYRDQYVHEAMNVLINNRMIKTQENTTLWRYCDENNIVLRNNIQRNCLKRELLNI